MTLEQSTVASYAIVIPPGWIHVPAGSTRAMLAAVQAQVGAAQVDAIRTRLGSRLDELVHADQDHRVLDGYMPAGPFPGTGIGASVAVATVEVEHEAGADPDRLLLARITSDAADVVDLGGAVAVRWTVPDDGDPTTTPETARLLHRSVVLGRVPGREDVLLTLVLSVVSETADAELLSAERAVAVSLDDLFTAMLSTFRWTDAQDRLRSDRPPPSRPARPADAGAR